MCPDIQELYVLTHRRSYTREQGDGKEQRAMIQNTSQSGTGAQGWSASLACTRPVSDPPARVLGLPGCRASLGGKPLHSRSSSCPAPLPTRCLCSLRFSLPEAELEVRRTNYLETSCHGHDHWIHVANRSTQTSQKDSHHWEFREDVNLSTAIVPTDCFWALACQPVASELLRSRLGLMFQTHETCLSAVYNKLPSGSVRSGNSTKTTV